MATYICADIYTVKPKDTLYDIAKKYHTNADLLMRVNGIRNPYNLRVGSRLCIPGALMPDGTQDGHGNRPPQDGRPGSRPPQDGRPGNRPPQDGRPSNRPPQDGRPGNRPPQDGRPGNRPPQDGRPGMGCKTIHVVKPGDTLYMIAKMHRVTLEALMSANPDIDPYQLQKGMELCIPV